MTKSEMKERIALKVLDSLIENSFSEGVAGKIKFSPLNEINPFKFAELIMNGKSYIEIIADQQKADDGAKS